MSDRPLPPAASSDRVISHWSFPVEAGILPAANSQNFLATIDLIFVVSLPARGWEYPGKAEHPLIGLIVATYLGAEVVSEKVENTLLIFSFDALVGIFMAKLINHPKLFGMTRSNANSCHSFRRNRLRNMGRFRMML